MELEKQAKFVIEMPGVPHALTQNFAKANMARWKAGDNSHRKNRKEPKEQDL